MRIRGIAGAIHQEARCIHVRAAGRLLTVIHGISLQTITSIPCRLSGFRCKRDRTWADGLMRPRVLPDTGSHHPARYRSSSIRCLACSFSAHHCGTFCQLRRRSARARWRGDRCKTRLDERHGKSGTVRIRMSTSTSGSPLTHYYF